MATKEHVSKVYDHGAKSTEKSAKAKEPTKTGHEAGEGEPSDVGSMDGRHKAERDEMQRRHETEVGQLSTTHRGEDRAMNLRHEGEYGGGAEEAAGEKK